MSNDNSSRYTREELDSLGFAELGEHVLIDRTCRLFGVERIKIGSNVRIDPFCFLSAGEGGITIGSYVHLSVGVTLSGAGGVVIEDFCGLSNRVSVFSANDDYSDGWMTNPTVPDEFKNVHTGLVTLKKHAIIGCGSVILPGLTIGLGASVGALSVVNKSVPDFMIVAGNPIRKVDGPGT